MTGIDQHQTSSRDGGFTPAYARWRATGLGRITDRLEETLLLELVGDLDNRKALDVGCGDGLLAIRLAQRGAQVTGLDPDPTMLAAVRQRAESQSLDVAVVRGRAEALPFADNSFDLVTAVTVLSFISQADTAIAEMTRVLRPGAQLVVGELGRWNLWAAKRRLQGWCGKHTWKSARFRAVHELHQLLETHMLTVTLARGAIYYPPSTLAARSLQHIDPWLGRHTTCGAAFVALAATKQ